MLRWKGGSGGDMILYLKSLSDPGSVINVDFCAVIESGKTHLDLTRHDELLLTELGKIALPDRNMPVDLKKLATEIESYVDTEKTVWAKSHYYKTTQFNYLTVDLVVDVVSLPFVVLCNLVKTNTLVLNFNQLSGLIPDPDIRLNYSMYCVAIDTIQSNNYISNQTIKTSELLMGVETFKSSIEKVNLGINFEFSYIYNDWFEKNKKYMPSQEYQDMVLSQNYDFFNTTLSKVERYSLMALSGNKFVNLQ
jgi:hypothetical protein